ncbi:hypothetical protein ACRALDRAFT_1080537 [Sodiomyces alcalophilus JCM 7366]|uniref:uncharacterized protein n=1 Tax=Sodiomyces alcalophilus JCM 7366 TaxID=591952 RepID=UPI0039B482C7
MSYPYPNQGYAPNQGYGQQQYPPQSYGQQPPPHSPYPPQQSPYPPQGYQQGAPPPSSPYGAPPHAAPPHGAPPHAAHGYGQPNHGPPPGPYGAPPPAAPYGQPQGYGPPSPAPPPSGHYGAPPPQPYQHQQQQQQYGAPPPGPPVPPTPPSIGYGPPQTIPWNADPDASAARAAMKGLGTNEKALIRCLATKDPLQIEAIKASFERQFRRNLEADVKSETSGWFREGLVSVVRGPLWTDVQNLRAALDGPGTKEVVLNDVLLGRSNADLRAIRQAYGTAFRRSLDDDVRGDLSMKTKRHFDMVLSATRAEDAAPVVPAQVDQDVMDLYRATEGKLGTDEMIVCSILTSRNDNQIRAIAHAYEQKFRKSLEQVIKSEFSGHMEDALLFQLRHGMDKYMHAAKLLEDAMKGLGTKDHLLVSRVVRFHWDKNFLSNVLGAYQQRYGKTLAKRIYGETSGDYRLLMLACIGERI